MLSACVTDLALTDTSASPGKCGQEGMLNLESGTDAESGPLAWNNKVSMFLQVVQQRRPQMMRLAYRFADTREEVEDIVQDALLNAFRYLPHFRGEACSQAPRLQVFSKRVPKLPSRNYRNSNGAISASE